MLLDISRIKLALFRLIVLTLLILFNLMLFQDYLPGSAVSEKRAVRAINNHYKEEIVHKVRKVDYEADYDYKVYIVNKGVKCVLVECNFLCQVIEKDP